MGEVSSSTVKAQKIQLTKNCDKIRQAITCHFHRKLSKRLQQVD